MKRFSILVCIAWLAMISFAAADTVNVDFNTGGYPGTLDTSKSVNVYSGAYKVVITPGDNTGLANLIDNGPPSGVPHEGSQWLLFCTELAQESTTSNVPYTVTQPRNVPLPEAPPLAPMGPDDETLLRKLYGMYFDDAFLSATNEMAFQMAVWEIVHETAVDDLRVANSGAKGDFYVTSTSNSAAVTQADIWLDSLAGSNTLANNLLAVSSLEYQDFLVWPTPGDISEAPAPSALVALLGMGAMMCLGRVRRRFARS